MSQIAPTDPANDVAEFLERDCVGRENAVTKKEIAEALGIDERHLHDIVTELIKRHAMPVCSACKPPMGYFLATTDAERSDNVESLKRRARRVFARRRALMRAPLWPRQPLRQRGLFEQARPEDVRQGFCAGSR